MKKTAILTLLLTLLSFMVLWFSGVASAETRVRLHANVPFAFYAEKELMPAGHYVFEIRSIGSGPTGSSVLIHNETGIVAGWVLTNPGAVPPAGNEHLHFNRYGNSYFLTKVEAAGFQANLRTTRLEKEVRAQTRSAKDTLIPAED